MAKRFTDTEKWNKQWYRSLSPNMKCFWDYINSRCCIAGIWEKDYGLASFFIGEAVTHEEVMDVFGDRLYEFDDKILVVDHVKFQYGLELNYSSRVHRKIVDRLAEYNLLDAVCCRVSNMVSDSVEEIEVEKEPKKEIDKEKAERNKSVITYLNQKTGKKFRFTKGHLRHVNARFSEGFEMDDFIKVIDFKVHQWKGDSKMDQFLRPSTLFSAQHFGEYLEASRTFKPKKKPVFIVA